MKTDMTNGQYCDGIIATSFTNWMELQLIPNLPHYSMVVVDSAWKKLKAHYRNNKSTKIALFVK